MARLKRFLRAHHVRGKDCMYNMVSLTGGKFLCSDRELFFKKYFTNYAKLSQKEATPLVFRAPKHGLAPLYLDFDFRRSHNERIPSSVLVEIAHEVLKHLQRITASEEELSFVLTRRANAYWKDKLKCYADGFHLFVTDLHVKKVTSFENKVGHWKMTSSFPKYKVKFVNSFEDIKVKFVSLFPGVKC